MTLFDVGLNIVFTVRPNIVIKNTDMVDLIRGNTAQQFASQTTFHYVTI